MGKPTKFQSIMVIVFSISLLIYSVFNKELHSSGYMKYYLICATILVLLGLLSIVLAYLSKSKKN